MDLTASQVEEWEAAILREAEQLRQQQDQLQQQETDSEDETDSQQEQGTTLLPLPLSSIISLTL